MTQTQEGLGENANVDPFKEIRDDLEAMAKAQLVRARADAVRGLARVVLTHPLAQEAKPKSASMANLGSIPPKELEVPEMGVSVKAEVWDMEQFVGYENSMITITRTTEEGAPEEEPRELGTSDKPLSGDFSLRDMQAVVDDIVALRAMQVKLTETE